MSFNVGTTNNAFKANFAENVSTCGSYTPTITSINNDATNILVEENSTSWVRLGDFVHIDGNCTLTLPQNKTDFTLLISPPVEYDIVEPVRVKPSGSLVATGGGGSGSTPPPMLVSAGWSSNIPGESNSNTFQVVMESNTNMQGEALTKINFHIVYKVVV